MEPEIVRSCAKMQEVIERAKCFADSDSPVLICGETGTGKELFAKFIHENSEQKNKPMKIVNCGALPETLVESLLFGTKKGIYTGCDRDHVGFFEAADGSTIFLDEIGELPLLIQIKLLRVLEDKIVLPLGAKEGKPVNFRLIAATNSDLEECIQNKIFRQDLFYRLNVLRLQVPSLRERGSGEIVFLAQHFLSELNKKHQSDKKFSDFVKKRIATYHWPGNVRELKNVIERAILLRTDDEIKDIEINASRSSEIPLELQKMKKYFIRKHLLEVLAATSGNRTNTAKVLGIERTYLSRMLKQFSISDIEIESFDLEEEFKTRVEAALNPKEHGKLIAMAR